MYEMSHTTQRLFSDGVTSEACLDDRCCANIENVRPDLCWELVDDAVLLMESDTCAGDNRHQSTWITWTWKEERQIHGARGRASVMRTKAPALPG